MPRRRSFFENLAHAASRWAGSSWAFALAIGTLIVWSLSGPIFGFSDTWQLVVNTGTTIVTFLMVFLIQRAQNNDAYAIQLKLNELLAAVKGASNRLINIEDLSEEELEALHRHFQQLTELAKRERSLTRSHSVEEARERHKGKEAKED
jgi:low affinity Fe/Cu permease